jgi:hypothetical protein
VPTVRAKLNNIDGAGSPNAIKAAEHPRSILKVPNCGKEFILGSCLTEYSAAFLWVDLNAQPTDFGQADGWMLSRLRLTINLLSRTIPVLPPWASEPRETGFDGT